MWMQIEWPSLANTKCESLEAQGMKPIGVILAVPDEPGQEAARRVTIDRWGRVQWWSVDGSGYMVPNDQLHRTGAELEEQLAKYQQSLQIEILARLKVEEREAKLREAIKTVQVTMATSEVLEALQQALALSGDDNAPQEIRKQAKGRVEKVPKV